MKQKLKQGEWLPEVLEGLEKMINAYGRRDHGADAPLAVFDLDQTCIRGDIGYAFFYNMVENVLFKHGYAPFRKFFLRYNMHGLADAVLEMLGGPTGASLDRNEMALLFYDIYGAIKKEKGDGECFEWMAGLLLGWLHDEVRDTTEKLLVREFSAPLGERVLAQGEGRRWVVPTGIRIYREMKNLISVLADNGFEVWIISATSQPIVEGAGTFLGVGPERCIGVRHEVDKGLLVALMETVTYRSGKVEAIKRMIGRKPVFAAGDWFTDLEMLDYCEGVSLLLDRGRKDLIKYGKKKGWMIQSVFTVD